MNFTDRHQEMQRLDNVASRRRGFVVLWGRRRVGKSRLLTEWSQRNDGLYTVADQSAPTVQRRYLASALATRFPGFDDVEYPDWQSLLRRLDRDADSRGWRGPLIVDELPYLVAAQPEILSVLQNWLDSPTRQIGLVTSGSSMRMMHSAVLDNGAPLYGRATEAFAIRPLRAGFLADVFPHSTHRELVSAYAVWGGMPRYWELAEPFGANLTAAVDALVLDPTGPLHHEPDRLLQAETPPAMALRPLLDVIGNGAHRVSEIAGRLGRPASSLAAPLAMLGDMDLIRREIPFGSDPKSGKRSLYQDRRPVLAVLVPRGRPEPITACRCTPRNPPAVLATASAAARSVRVGGTLPHGSPQSAPRGARDRRVRPVRQRATVLARQRSRTGHCGAFRNGARHPGRRSQVERERRRTGRNQPSVGLVAGRRCARSSVSVHSRRASERRRRRRRPPWCSKRCTSVDDCATLPR